MTSKDRKRAAQEIVRRAKKTSRSKNNNTVPQESDFLLYTTPEGDVRVDVLFSNETVWLTQKRMADLFGVDVRTISEHIQNIFKTGELLEDSVIRKFRKADKI